MAINQNGTVEFGTITANGDSTAYVLRNSGEFLFDVTGTFASANTTLYIMPLGHAAYYAPSPAISVAGGQVFKLGSGDTVKTTTAAATGSTSLTATLRWIG